MLKKPLAFLELFSSFGLTFFYFSKQVCGFGQYLQLKHKMSCNLAKPSKMSGNHIKEEYFF